MSRLVPCMLCLHMLLLDWTEGSIYGLKKVHQTQQEIKVKMHLEVDAKK